MGNDNSRLKGLIIDKNAVEANDFWALHNAELPTTSNEEGRQLLSIFQGEAVVNGQLWSAQGPMERAIKNFKIYRHPYILKYVSTWEQSGQKHLATERVQPLSSILCTLSDIQVCLGLRTILCSLIFLVEKAMARHLNICPASIYVTADGSWRLAGFEYVWKQKELNKKILDLAKSYRYKDAIDPSEVKENNIEFIEQYAFATLCEEILKKCSIHGKRKSEKATTPYVQEFQEYCANHLKHSNAQMRPKLSAVLLHPYFNHEFVLIHSFLFELPLKSLHEKQEFFTGLIDRLRYFNEDVVGSLAADLLSRMVLLDPTAQLCVTPYVLRTKADHPASLFSNHTYTRHLLPHIKKMFRLRDAQIRLILLEYFMDFVRLLSKEEIEDFILPHLLAGMNDTNDVLVAKTLRCLADLIPILGSTSVLGGNRTRLFSDGRPQAAVPDGNTHWVEPRSITPVLGGGDDCMVSGSPMPTDNLDIIDNFLENNGDGQRHYQLQSQVPMPPRLSPDGGESDKISNIRDGMCSNKSVKEQQENENSSDEDYSQEEIAIGNQDNGEEEEDLAWSDWETEAQARQEEKQNDTVPSNGTKPPISSSTSSSSLKQSSSRVIDDLNAFDIKIQKIPLLPEDQEQEIDFFKDMEPVIRPTASVPEATLLAHNHVTDSYSKRAEVSGKSQLAFADLNGDVEGLEDSSGDGWLGDEDDINLDLNITNLKD